MSNIIELNVTEIDTVVGGTDRTRTPPEINPNRTMTATNSAFSANVSRPGTASTYSSSDFRTRLDTVR